jgi:hypothetical protein
MRRTKETIQYRARLKTWVGRVTTIADDGAKEKSPWLDLLSSNRDAAQRTYDQWLASGVPPRQNVKETFEHATDRYLGELEEERAAATDVRVQRRIRKDIVDRTRRLRAFAIPAFGQVEVSLVEPSHVASALDAAHHEGLARGSILHLRSDISVILAMVMREGGVKTNAAADVKLHRRVRMDSRPRTVPTDADLLLFRQRRGFEEEIDMAVLIARDVAGQRQSCVLAADWSDVDLDTFDTWRVRRPKTDTETGELAIARRVRAYEKVEHGIPVTVQAPLHQWWCKQGRPTCGPIFPLQREGVGGDVELADGRAYRREASAVGGEKASQGNSYARAFRRALWDAGIYSPLPGFDPAHPDPKLCAYQTDTKTTRRTDFHSIRRAYVTALKRVQLPDADVLALAGHTQLSTSTRYDTERRVQTPDAALPGGNIAPVLPVAPLPPPPPNPTALMAALDALRAALSGSAPASGADVLQLGSLDRGKVAESLARPPRFERGTSGLEMRGSAGIELDPRILALLDALGRSVDQEVQPHVVGLRIAAASAVALGDWALADKVRALLTPPPPAGVADLSEARTRRRG